MPSPRLNDLDDFTVRQWRDALLMLVICIRETLEFDEYDLMSQRDYIVALEMLYAKEEE